MKTDSMLSTRHYPSILALLVIFGLFLATAISVARADDGVSLPPAGTSATTGVSADVADAQSTIEGLKQRLIHVRNDAQQAKRNADIASQAADQLLFVAQNCLSTFNTDLQTYNERSHSADLDISDLSIWNKQVQADLARAKTSVNAVQDDKQRQYLSDDIDSLLGAYQPQIDTLTKQAKESFSKAQATAKLAQQIYDQKCRPVLEPQQVVLNSAAYQPSATMLGLDLRPLRTIICPDGRTFYVPETGFTGFPYTSQFSGCFGDSGSQAPLTAPVLAPIILPGTSNATPLPLCRGCNTLPQQPATAGQTPGSMTTVPSGVSVDTRVGPPTVTTGPSTNGTSGLPTGVPLNGHPR